MTSDCDNCERFPLTNELAELIRNEKWEDVIEALQKNEQKDLARVPINRCCVHRTTDLPLHLAVLKSAPNEVILELLSVYGGAAEVSYASGELPLHRALRRKLSETSVLAILKTYPESATTMLHDKSCALHVSLDCASSAKTILAIFEAHRDAVHIQAPASSYYRSEPTDGLPLYTAIKKNAQNEVIQALAEAYMESKTNMGCSHPLHVAIEKGFPLCTIQILAEVDEKMNKPTVSSNPDFLQLAFRQNSPESVVLYLLDKNKAAAKIAFSGGDLPLHHAIVNRCSDDVILALFSAFEEAVMIKNSKSMQYPLYHAIAAYDSTKSSYPKKENARQKPLLPSTLEVLIKKFPQALDHNHLRETVTEKLDSKSIRMIMTPTHIWERNIHIENKTDKCKQIEALEIKVKEISANVAALRKEVVQSQAREQELIAKLESLKNKRKGAPTEGNINMEDGNINMEDDSWADVHLDIQKKQKNEPKGDNGDGDAGS